MDITNGDENGIALIFRYTEVPRSITYNGHAASRCYGKYRTKHDYIDLIDES